MTCSTAFGADATSMTRDYTLLSLRISLEPPFAMKQSPRETTQSGVHSFKSKPVNHSHDQVEEHSTAYNMLSCCRTAPTSAARRI